MMFLAGWWRSKIVESDDIVKGIMCIVYDRDSLWVTLEISKIDCSFDMAASLISTSHFSTDLWCYFALQRSIWWPCFRNIRQYLIHYLHEKYNNISFPWIAWKINRIITNIFLLRSCLYTEPG
jgi:hypothetical protein